jgi:hypothetical protein
MSGYPNGSKTNIDVNLNQDFDIDFKSDRTSVSRENETTNTTTNNTNYNKSIGLEVTHTQGYKKAFELETTHTTNTNKNVDIDIDKDVSTYTETVELDVTKTVTENIKVDQTYKEDWTVKVNVNSDNIIQNSYVTSDVDVNDVDISGLINVAGGAKLSMDDFNLDVTSIGDSFNGLGNDSFVSANQSNNLVDNDHVGNTYVGYANQQKPNVSGNLEASYDTNHEAGSGADAEWEHTYEGGGLWKPKYEASSSGSAGYWWHAASSSAAALTADLTLSAPEKAFQTVEGEGGTAEAGDGIASAHISNAANGNAEDGSIAGDASASADGIAKAEAFTSEIMAGGNQQANFATLNVVGGNKLDAGDVSGYHPAHGGGYGGDHEAAADGIAIKDSKVTLDDDLNDVDTSNLINVQGNLEMDDFDLDIDSIASSFNGPGNDMAFDINQSNDLVDNDNVYGTAVAYHGSGWNGPFQSVSAYGGDATAGNGIGGIGGHGLANYNGGSGTIAGSTAASADAMATAQAFTSNIVVGANLQVNNLSATIVGGDSAQLDDIGLGH